mgnify:CR=1 FL=1|tara:strand:- start:51578 stop:52054 length:477 start_codon:yes stop_codon:yes gene_type:complete
MKTYTTTQRVKSGGKLHLPGNPIELDSDTAAELEAIGAIKKGAPTKQEDDTGTLLGSFPSEIEIAEGVAPTGNDLVQFVAKTVNADADAWNSLPDAERQRFIKEGFDLLKAVHQAGVDNKGKNPTVAAVKKILGEDIDGKSKDAAWAFLESLDPAAKE